MPEPYLVWKDKGSDDARLHTGATSGITVRERYAENEFRDARRLVHGADEVDQVALAALLRTSTVPSLWSKNLEGEVEKALPIRLTLQSSQIGDVGRVLVDLDFEIRRAVGFVATGTTRPLRERSALSLLGARQGIPSTVYLLAKGTIMDAFSTQPLEVVLAASWFWAHRSNQTKYRGIMTSEKYLAPLDDIVRSASVVLSNSRPSMFVIRLEDASQFRMGFQSL